MDLNNLKYVVFDYSEADKIDFTQVNEISKDTLTISVDGTKTLVKWFTDETPECISALNSKSVIYNIEDILNLISSPEWNVVSDEIIN